MTLAKAAELSSQTLGEFIDLLRVKQIPWMEYTQEHFTDDERAIQDLLVDSNNDKE